MSIAFSSALYYPHIEIEDEQWLRSAVLFWDSIGTIVPMSQKDPYKSNFARALMDEGVLRPVRVQSDMEEIEALTDKVLDYLTDPASVGVMFGAETSQSVYLDPEKMSHELRDFIGIHPEKLPHMIRSNMMQFHDQGVLRVPARFGNYYMTLLATQLAERLGLGLVTESRTANQLAVSVHQGKPWLAGDFEFPFMGWFGHHPFGPRRSLPQEVEPGLLIDLIMQGVRLPQDVDVKTMLKFKNDHADELSLLRREVGRLTAELPKDAPIEALRQAANDQYNNCVLPAINSLRKSLKAQGWDEALGGFLRVSFFTAAPTSLMMLAGMPSSLALVVGAGVSLTASAIHLVNQRQQVRNSNPYSYLLSLENQW